ncbi:PAAR domain-containing protein [Paraburkholderia panacisoli]|uniref:PAAR domain-containing protein n=2 Tax=Paraburkholderia panacisoli TaxID=2603818 RepID=A0A5B0HLS8_9BURK|nr:PAAR domain-containing protein [Paraburkholderia panacisoli]
MNRTIRIWRHGSARDCAGQDRNAGIPLARKGDLIECPLHPEVRPNITIEGDESMDDEGRPIARAGHRGTCGCHLISSLI